MNAVRHWGSGSEYNFFNSDIKREEIRIGAKGIAASSRGHFLAQEDHILIQIQINTLMMCPKNMIGCDKSCHLLNELSRKFFSCLDPGPLISQPSCYWLDLHCFFYLHWQRPHVDSRQWLQSSCCLCNATNSKYNTKEYRVRRPILWISNLLAFPPFCWFSGCYVKAPKATNKVIMHPLFTLS